MSKTIDQFERRVPLGYFKGAPFYPIKGAEYGTNTQGDIVTQTIDGQPINNIWSEFQLTLDILNDQRSAVTSLLAYSTTRSVDAVAQAVTDGDEFQRATEFGEPVGVRPPTVYLNLGYPFHDYDVATRYTWKFLRDASSDQVEALHQRVLSADNGNTTKAILRRLLTPTASLNEDGRTVYGLWNNDGIVPPSYLFNTFAGTHNHYMVSGAAEVDGKDIDALYANVAEHGYLEVPGSRAVLFVNPLMMDKISRIRVTDTVEPAYDFIPSQAAPAFLTNETIIGDRAPAEFNGLKIAGSYGEVWIAPTAFMPNNYMLLVATGGPGNSNNPVAFREHVTQAYRGLRLLPGNNRAYPLVDSFYSRGFGVGVRHRGAAAVMQIKEPGTYDIPTI